MAHFLDRLALPTELCSHFKSSISCSKVAVSAELNHLVALRIGKVCKAELISA